MKVTLIQCTKTKRTEPAIARELYDESDYFRKMRAYAEARNNPWYILSAKHGLVAPSDELEPYDSFGLSEAQAQEIAGELEQLGVTVIDLIAGQSYKGPLLPELERVGIDVIDNFAGLGIGETKQQLLTKTKELENKPIDEW